jgi:hypothetical protein
VSPTVDRDQLRALRVLRYWFTEDQVEVLGMVDRPPQPPPAPVQGALQLDEMTLARAP